MPIEEVADLPDVLEEKILIPSEDFDTLCSVCGRPVVLIATGGMFGEREADAVIFKGEPVCYGCLEKAS